MRWKGRKRIVFGGRRCKFGEDSAYFSERLLGVRHEHQTKTADSRVEDVVFQVKLFSVHNARGDGGQPLLLCHSCSYVEHLGRNIGCQNGRARSDESCCKYTLIPGARRNVKDVIPRLECRRFEHTLCRYREIVPTPLDILLPALGRLR